MKRTRAWCVCNPKGNAAEWCGFAACLGYNRRSVQYNFVGFERFGAIARRRENTRAHRRERVGMNSIVKIERAAWLLALVLLTCVALVCASAMAAPARAQDDKSKAADEKKKDKKDEKENQTLPPETPPKGRFPTDEGRWMSVDIPPDFKQIVFDLLGVP